MSLISKIDQLRIILLQYFLKKPIVRALYISRSSRLFVTYLFTFIVCSTLSILRPDLLLIIGPLTYGLLHLFSSYLFTLKLISPKTYLSSQFRALCFVTVGFVFIKYFFFYQKPIFGMPNGIPALILTSLTFLYFRRKVTKENRLKPFVLVLLFNTSVIPWAMDNPLLFVSATLFLHNWVAFFAWTLQAKTRQDKNVAIVSTLVFALFNILILMGFLDSLFPEVIQGKFLHANIESTTWILSPWTDDIMVGQRALCLYTLGLSLHYFIWLKAIPECNHTSQTPPSFRASMKKLDAEVGRGPIMTFIGLFLVLLTIWLYSFALGSYIYFLVAGLHFWVELIGLALINLKRINP